MLLGVPKEVAAGERRVALVPDTIGRLLEGVDVVVEAGAGLASAFTDDAYVEAGTTTGDPWTADVVAKVAAPTPDEAGRLHSGQALIAFLDPSANGELLGRLGAAGVSAFALEAI